jgi:hypothetical protein
MIVVRNVFRLKFGMAREAVALWQEGLEVLRRAGLVENARLMTDLTGPFYTLVVESTYEDIGAMERMLREESALPEWRALYQRFLPLAESGYRELFTLVGSTAPSLPTSDARVAARG